MDIRSTVYDIVASYLPEPGDRTKLHDGADLTDLGLDSIATVEVLVECEKRFGVSSDELLNAPALTIDRIVTYFGQKPA